MSQNTDNGKFWQLACLGGSFLIASVAAYKTIADNSNRIEEMQRERLRLSTEESEK
jgi:hypothetical protein